MLKSKMTKLHEIIKQKEQDESKDKKNKTDQKKKDTEEKEMLRKGIQKEKTKNVCYIPMKRSCGRLNKRNARGLGNRIVRNHGMKYG